MLPTASFLKIYAQKHEVKERKDGGLDSPKEVKIPKPKKMSKKKTIE